MPDFRIQIALAEMIPGGAQLTSDSFPALSQAVRVIAEDAQAQWRAYALGAPLPSGKSIGVRSGTYERSIQLRQLGEFAAEVYSELPYAQAIEEGAPERDLKQILNSSLKVRRTSDGRRYLIIPIRHNQPNSGLGNAMPEAVHGWWQGKDPSHVVRTFLRSSGTGAYDIKTRQRVMVPGWGYHWGTRLRASDLAGMGIGGDQAKKLQGMVNFRKIGAKGGSSHSQFLTFRTMMEGSKGWIAPAREGLHPAKTTAEMFQPVAEQAFERAVTEDIQRALEG